MPFVDHRMVAAAHLVFAALCVIYLAVAIGKVYRAGRIRRWLSAGVLTVVTLYILWVCRFLLLVVTVWAT